jgi:tetratricopeptide (TPR) repeat protein
MLMTLLFLISTIAYGQSAFAKAEQLFKTQKYDKALTAFTNLYKEDSKNLDVVERLGDMASYKKDFETAMAYYKMLVETQPNNAQYNFKYGGSMGLYAKEISKLKALGMLDDIKMHLKKAAQLDPKHIKTRHALSQLYCELPGIVGGSIKQSRFYANELLNISPVDGYLAHGLIDEYEEDYQQAIISYTNAIDSGGSLLTYRKLATVYQNKLKDNKKALKTLKRAQEKHKDTQLTADIAGLEIRVQMNE